MCWCTYIMHVYSFLLHNYWYITLDDSWRSTFMLYRSIENNLLDFVWHSEGLILDQTYFPISYTVNMHARHSFTLNDLECWHVCLGSTVRNCGFCGPSANPSHCLAHRPFPNANCALVVVSFQRPRMGNLCLSDGHRMDMLSQKRCSRRWGPWCISKWHQGVNQELSTKMFLQPTGSHSTQQFFPWKRCSARFCKHRGVLDRPPWPVGGPMGKCRSFKPVASIGSPVAQTVSASGERASDAAADVGLTPCELPGLGGCIESL